MKALKKNNETVTPFHIIFYSNHLRGPKGSAGARSWHQTKYLANSNFITVIIPAIDPVSSTPVTEETYEGLNKQNTTVLKVWTTKNNRSSKLSRALFYLTGMFSQFSKGLSIKKPDAILSMSLPVTLLTVAVLISKIRHVPLVVDVRDLPFETAKELGYIKSKILIKALKWIENLSLRQASFVLTNSPRYKPYLVRYGIPEQKIYVAPIGFDDFPQPKDSLVKKWRTDLLKLFSEPPRFLAIYAGTIGYAFPVEEILEGAKLLKKNKEIGFVFLGDGQRLEPLRKFAKENSINAFFFGRVSKKDIHAVCKATDICLYPAKEGEFSASILGNKVFDYLGAEKPIVYVGPDSAVSDVIIELNAGIICPPKNPKAFSNAIETLTKEPELMRKLSDGAKSFRNAGYTAQASAKTLGKLIGKAIDNHTTYFNS